MHEWACEACLWAAKAQLSGSIVSGMTGSAVVAISAEEFQRIALLHVGAINTAIKKTRTYVFHVFYVGFCR